MTFDRKNSAGFLVNHLARLLTQEIQARLSPLDLAVGAFPALLELWEEEGLTQKQLVERLDIEQATMANTLSRMERDGLIRRSRDEVDGRIQRIWLTDRGRALEAPAKAGAVEVNELLRGNLGDSECEQFLADLRTRIEWLKGERKKAKTPAK